MKHLQFLVCPILLLSGLSASAHHLSRAEHAPKKEVVAIRKIFAPEGYDDNDNVQVVGSGIFSSTCYRYAETEVKVNDATKTIQLTPMAYHYDGMCLQVLLPFEASIDFGILKKGLYSIVQASDGKVLGQINIRASITKNPDDFVYAPISQAFFQSKNSTNTLFLTGSFPLSCMAIDDVRVSIQANALVVQPVTKMLNGVPCVAGKFDFETVTETRFIKTGRYLLHVRSMNGKSVNTLVDVP